MYVGGGGNVCRRRSIVDLVGLFSDPQALLVKSWPGTKPALCICMGSSPFLFLFSVLAEFFGSNLVATLLIDSRCEFHTVM